MLAGIHSSDTTARRRGPGGGNVDRRFTDPPQKPAMAPTAKLTAMMAADCGPAWQDGKVAVWSFKPTIADVLAGKWRSPVQDAVAYAREQAPGRTIFVPWHEPENDVGKGKLFASPAEFVTGFNMVHDWIVEADPGAVTAHSALGYSYARMTDKQAAAWRTKARLNVGDFYSGRTFPLATILPNHPGYPRWRTQVAGDGPWGISERGWTTTGNGNSASALRAASMARELVWLLQQNDLRLYQVWDTDGAEGDAGLLLDSLGDEVAQAMVAALLSGPQRLEIVCPTCAGTGRLHLTGRAAPAGAATVELYN